MRIRKGRSPVRRQGAIRWRGAILWRGATLWLTAAVCVLAASVLAGYAAALAVHTMSRDDAAALAVPLPEALPAQAAAESVPAAPDGDAAFEYLPVIRHGSAEKKQIAVTVDDCFQVDNLRTIIDTAEACGGRLTLFPIGQNLEKPGMAKLLRHGVFDLGFEVENHTWSHQRIFRLPEAQMAEEIWRQGQAVNRALGVSYEQHFFRLMGGDGECDQRTHNYLGQLGFRGIASWSLSGSDADMTMIQRALKPGAVYLFHTTDADTEKLKAFLPYAVAQGYELVTLNELTGCAPNAVGAYAEQAMPAPRAYRCDLRDRRLGDYAWCVVGMQDALRRLGCLKLDGPSTGYYGRQTRDAIAAFQRISGLPETGVADAETQRRLLANCRTAAE